MFFSGFPHSVGALSIGPCRLSHGSPHFLSIYSLPWWSRMTSWDLWFKISIFVITTPKIYVTSPHVYYPSKHLLGLSLWTPKPSQNEHVQKRIPDSPKIVPPTNPFHFSLSLSDVLQGVNLFDYEGYIRKSEIHRTGSQEGKIRQTQTLKFTIPG